MRDIVVVNLEKPRLGLAPGRHTPTCDYHVTDKRVCLRVQSARLYA